MSLNLEKVNYYICDLRKKSLNRIKIYNVYTEKQYMKKKKE